ncbi:MAG: glycosyltransferase family 39 protein [Beijerinckiaceae bacterium]|nr:glycosyltransferase family 39 protein [Beijerinckiaceae bacterium]
MSGVAEARASSPRDSIPLWLLALIAAHALTWMTLPSLLEGSIRLDVSEGAIGGREWQLAYLRHPPFTTWLTEIARWAGPLRYTAVHAIGQVLALGGLCLMAAAAGRMEGEAKTAGRAATLTVLLGLASPALTYIPIQLNHNIGLMLASGLVVMTAWQAFEQGGPARWLAFGIAVGLSLWVKYAVGLLVLPLMLAFLIVPVWRRQLLTPSPWLAVVAACIVIFPHAVFVLDRGATTVAFATRTLSTGFVVNLVYAGEFLANAALFMLPMAAVAALHADGVRPLAARIALSLSREMTRADLFRHVITFGPVLVTALAALIAGVKPRLLWLTPMIPAFALWWAHFAASGAADGGKRAGERLLAALAVLLATSYIVVRLVSPYVNAKPLYPDFDGPALAAMARDHWKAHEQRPLAYIVSFGQQRGRQAAGSIAFDLPSTNDAPIHVMEDGSLAASPWIDVTDLKKHGALVVSPMKLEAGTTVQGMPMTDIIDLPRPMVRGARTNARVWFGIVKPGA